MAKQDQNLRGVWNLSICGWRLQTEILLRVWKTGEVEMIQIDMPMPTNCLDCPACNEYLTCAIPVNGRQWGENDVREYGNGRPEWCPMKEQEAVVRCKDCKHYLAKGILSFCNLHGIFRVGCDCCPDEVKRE